MTWPSEKVVAAALGCHAAVIVRTPHGSGRGVQSSDPGVYLIVVGPHRAVAFCDRCGDDAREELPPPPTSRGLNGQPEPLFAPGTRAHALHALTWLHDYGCRHESCNATSESALRWSG